MKKLQPKQLFYLFLVAWFLLNLVQASFTELDPDEAYYWMYHKELAWGYFDHPPAIAVLIHWGTQIFPGTLGVRFFSVLLMTGSFYLLWLTIAKNLDRQQTILWISLLAAMPMLHVYTFIATPDAPLLFFGALYLWIYHKFVNHTSWTWSIALGVCMAALLYSKYHGILWIVLLLLSNLKVLRDPRYYAAGILGVVLFFPHLYWQYSNEFPSFRYHLSGRDDIYELKYTITYLLNQVVIFSPFLFPLLVGALWKFKPKNSFQKGWIYLIIGFWSLFFFLTAKGHAEPQWTVLLSFPIAFLLFEACKQGLISTKWTLRMSWLSLGFLIVARIFLIAPLPNLDTDFHKRAWIAELKAKAGDLPILFMDSYRDPSKYSFYSGDEAYTLTDVYYRKNQFDLWDWEKVLHNQSVFVVAQRDLKCPDCQTMELIKRGEKTYIIADSFQVSQNVWIDDEFPSDTIVIGQTYSVELNIQNPYEHTIQQNTGSQPLELYAIMTDDQEYRQWYLIKSDWEKWPGNSSTKVRGTFMVPSLVGESQSVYLQFGIRTGDLHPAYHSKAKPVYLQN